MTPVANPTIAPRSVEPPVADPPTPAPAATDDGWKRLTNFNFASLPIDDMPPDDDNVAPIAAEGETTAGSSTRALADYAEALTTWPPGKVADPVERVRNYLILIGAADAARSSLERFLPGTTLAHMLKEIPAEDLAKILCWIALHPDEGNLAPILKDPLTIDMVMTPPPENEVRQRVYFYAVKLTRWVIGW